MNFEKLHNDTNCNCLEDAELNLDRFFARKINKPLPTDRDFISKWEKGNAQIEWDKTNCQLVCGLKGISINQWNEISQVEVIQKFLTTFRISPKHKDSILIFKCRGNAGLIKFTPNSKDNFHYDFYKSDDFNLDLIDNIEIISLANFL